MEKQELVDNLLFAIGLRDKPTLKTYQFLSQRTRLSELKDLGFLFGECKRFSRKNEFLKFFIGLSSSDRQRVTRKYCDMVPVLDKDFIILGIPCKIQPIGYRDNASSLGGSLPLYAISELLNYYKKSETQELQQNLIFSS